MSEALTELAEQISSRQSDAVLATEIVGGELNVTVVPSALVKFMTFLRDDAACQFSTMIDLTAVDYPGRDKRFDLVFHLLSMQQNQRIRVRAGVREKEIVPSVTGVFPVADWYEREVFDMFGIMFAGHPDLRRILTDYGFRGHPLRKDFPTTGYTEVRYDETVKRVVYEPVSLTQDYRAFDFMSPWEGAEYILPGDDKAKEAAK